MTKINTDKLVRFDGRDGVYPAAVAVPGLYEILDEKIPDTKLQVGDVIPFSQDCWIIRDIDHVQWTAFINVVDIDGNERQDQFKMSPNDQGGWSAVARCKAAVAAQPKQDPNMWNGRCPKCGKGTYTGFASTQHEDGGCP